jgi:hypothetical protein
VVHDGARSWWPNASDRALGVPTYLIAAMSGWVLLCSRRIRLDDMPFLPGSPDQAAAPDTPPDRVYANSFPLVRATHSNPLRSRERRFESCRGTKIEQVTESSESRPTP